MKEEILDTPIWDKKTDFTQSFGAYFPGGLVILGIVFFAVGTYLIFTLNLLGGLFIIVGLVLVFAKKQTTVSFSLGKYKESFGLFNYKSGSWKSLPICEYISVFSAIESQNVNFTTNQATITNLGVIYVNLIHSRNQRLSVFKTEKIEEAFKVAHIFANELELDIFDATNREKNWITRDK